MKKSCLALIAAATIASATAQAADMAVKAPPPPIPVPIFTWTGFYLGGNVGGAWTSNRIWEDRFGLEWNRSSDARFIGGGQIGYNWQFNSFVLGIEGDIDGMVNKSRNNVVFVPTVGNVAVASNGDIFIVQGHTPGPKGDARVLKFDKTGRFLTQWGGKGTAPGQFEVAHGIAIDAKGLLWVADRENQRIQLFDQKGTYVREMKYAGLPCAMDIGRQYVYMVNGFAGQVVRMDLAGKVLAVVGRPGKGLGEFGEAHFIAVSPKQELFVADSVNGALVKFVKK